MVTSSGTTLQKREKMTTKLLKLVIIVILHFCLKMHTQMYVNALVKEHSQISINSPLRKGQLY